MSSRRFADQRLECAACGDTFVFSAGEQELNQLRGIAQLPEHCPMCTRTYVVHGTNGKSRPAAV